MFTIQKKSKNITANIHLPGSKSISNRLLILNFLNGGNYQLDNLSTADDTILLQQLLQKIAEHQGNAEEMELDCKNAGTVYRFLTALLSITPGKWKLTGCNRLQERPIDGLVEALKTLGADITYAEKDKFAPLLIKGKKLQGSSITVSADKSSQFVSAIMLIAPSIAEKFTIKIDTDSISLPYIQMTATILTLCGLNVGFDEDHNIIIEGKTKQELHYTIESDWTCSSYFYAMAALSDNAEIFFPNLKINSIQGDAVLADIFDPFGIKTTYEENGVRITKCMDFEDDYYFMDFSDYPDLAQTMAVLCAALGIEAELAGLQSLQYKETNRLKALQSELLKIGVPASLDKEEFALLLQQGHINLDVPINCYDDHRMAMAFSVLAMIGDVIIDNGKIVEKSFPNYWQELEKIKNA